MERFLRNDPQATSSRRMMMQYCGNAFLEPSYRGNPDKERSMNGFLSFVLVNKDNAPDFMKRWESFVPQFEHTLCARRSDYIISYHGNAKDFDREHIHVLAWHYRGCSTSKFLTTKASLLGFELHWRKVGCLACAKQYILVGRGDKHCLGSRLGCDLLSPHCGRLHDDNDSVRSSQELRPESRNTPPSPSAFCSQASSIDLQRPRGAPYARPDSAMDAPKITKGQERGLVLCKWAQKFIEEKGVQDYTAYEFQICHTDDMELLDNHLAQSQNSNYMLRIEQMIKVTKIKSFLKPWKTLCEKINLSNYVCETFATEPASAYFLWYWIEKQGFEVRQFCQDLWDILDRKEKKKNCLYVYGDANCFKTTVLMSICRSCNWFSVLSGIDKNNVRFAFQNTLNDRCVYWDEIRASEATSEIIKCILGGESVSVDVKYLNPQSTKRIPFLCSSNAPVWEGLPMQMQDTFRTTVQKRGICWKSRPLNVTNSKFKEEVNPNAWKTVMGQCDLWPEYRQMDDDDWADGCRQFREWFECTNLDCRYQDHVYIGQCQQRGELSSDSEDEPEPANRIDPNHQGFWDEVQREEEEVEEEWRALFREYPEEMRDVNIVPNSHYS